MVYDSDGESPYMEKNNVLLNKLKKNKNTVKAEYMYVHVCTYMYDGKYERIDQ